MAMNVIYTKATPQVIVHKLELIGYESHFSAWFALDGTLQDAERIDRRGRNYTLTGKQRSRVTKAWPLVSYYAGLSL